LSAPVEKSGPDFHRLAVPTRSKSPIRSVPKSGSGVVTLEWHQLDSHMSRVCVTCTELVRSTRSNMLPGGDCNKGPWVPQGPMQMDKVIRAVSGIEEPGSATLPRFHQPPGNRGFLHQANLSAQEALPPAGARLSPPHVHKGRRQTGLKPPSQGAPPPDPVAGFEPA
jgi:hypothetical protein